MYFTPSEEEIERVMKDLGFDRMQAIYHIRGTRRLPELAQRLPCYPLGKSQHFA